MNRRRHLLEERIDWLDTFPHRMTVGALLKALRIVHRAVEPLEPLRTPIAVAEPQNTQEAI